MAKVIYYITRRTSENRIPSLMWMLHVLHPEIMVRSSKEKLIYIENIDENFINGLTVLVSDFYQITFIEIFTESGCKKLDSAAIYELLSASKTDIEDLRPALTKLEHSISWARNIKKASSRTMVDLIYSSINQISMRYGAAPSLDIEVGDIVEVNFGFHLPGETSGNHSRAIVCFSEDDILHVVPLVRKSFVQAKPHSCALELDLEQCDSYYSSKSLEGVALLRRCKGIRIERVNAKVGKINSEFMKKILSELHKAFDFRNI